MAVRGSVPKTMKALVAYSKDDYRFEPEYPVPECGRMISLSKRRPVGSVPVI